MSMEAARSLTRQGQERKQQLIDHAAALFAERGYAETRVVDIVRAAGVAKGLFYWYFENKEALFRELVDDLRQRMRKEQARAIDPDADPLTRVRQGVEASLRFMGEHRRLYSLFEIENLDPDMAESLRQSGDIHVRDTAKHIKAGIDAGLVRDENPMLLAHGVVGTVALFSHLMRTGRVDLPIDELAVFTGRYVEGALRA